MVSSDTQNGSSSITATQANTFFISLPSDEIWTLGSADSTRDTHYQKAIHALLARAQYEREKIEFLYRSLAGIAAQAHALTDIEALELASEIMLALPVSSQRKNLTRCYKAFCMMMKGEFGLAREPLDQVLEEERDPRLRSRALLTKGATYFYAGEVDKSLSFYVQGGQLARDWAPAFLIRSLHMVAVIKSVHGDHDQALNGLESLLPTVFRVSRFDPKIYAAVLNSLAVELGEVGQVEQALQVVSTVAAFSPLVPEISETIAELESKQATKKRSVVVIHRQADSASNQRVEPCLKKQRQTQPAFKLWYLESNRTTYRGPPAVRVVTFTPAPTASRPLRGPGKPRAPPGPTLLD